MARITKTKDMVVVDYVPQSFWDELANSPLSKRVADMIDNNCKKRKSKTTHIKEAPWNEF